MVPPKKVLIANRGEIAIRIARACAEAGAASVAVYPADDAGSLHVRRADEAVELPGAGPAAYLDIAAVVDAAARTGCDSVHPGYGFLAENPALAAACAAAGLTFVGPSPEVLTRFGDKGAARHLAGELGVPVLLGTNPGASIEDVAALLAEQGSVMIKAVAGGGGRGMRPVTEPEELAEAYERCRSEATAAFGSGDLYAEAFLPDARHIEVQIVADGTRAVAVGDRDCSVQRRRQKLVEVAPALDLADELRAALHEGAVRLAEAVGYRGVGTFEFLVAGRRWEFIEANARLQVEHTVTEEVTGVDLVRAQLLLAGGSTLDDLGLAEPPPTRGVSIQCRVNLERIDATGDARPTGGTIGRFEPPSGPGVRVDTYGTGGYTTNPRYDSLLAKVVTTGATFDEARRRARRALHELVVEGVVTNRVSLLAVLDHASFAPGVDTRWFEREAAAFATPDEPGTPGGGAAAPGRAGAAIDTSDPLAVLDLGRAATGPTPAPRPVGAEAPDGTVPVAAPVQGTVVEVPVAVGDAVAAGATLAVMEAMKMEHVVTAASGGVVRRVDVSPGDTVFEGYALLLLEPADVDAAEVDAGAEVDLDHVRPDLAEVVQRHAYGLDENRPDAVARRRRSGQRTARENLDDLVDAGSFIEYGALALAAQRRRRPLQDLIERTPGDGLVGGVGTVDGRPTAVMSYDYTVLAGTQGLLNHRKKDRLFEITARQRLPLVFFTEGGGGRPGDTDGTGVAGLDCLAFRLFGELSGLVPLVGIVSGRCFAGNAALLGCCDVVIATEGSNIGMGGPAMIEGGGLGVFRPDEVGPVEDQVAGGVIDVLVRDEAEAVAVAKRYLSYFGGAAEGWECADQRLLRSAIPENRLRIYDIRAVIETLCDSDSVLELRRGFGAGMVTALARIEGRPLGIVANNPAHLAGAIDSDGADKAARFLQLCDAHDLPVLFLCDTPGIMVGPEAEKTGLVRHASRLFVTGAGLSVPFFTIVLRKGYGLGAQAMAGGSFHAPLFTVGWPTSEFGGMGLEGAVKLGYRNELAAIEDPEERRRTFQEMVARMYEVGKGVNMASHFEIDDVIDPAESRLWVGSALRGAPAPIPRTGKKRPNVDTW